MQETPTRETVEEIFSCNALTKRTTFHYAVSRYAPYELVQRMLDLSRLDPGQRFICMMPDSSHWLPIHSSAAFNDDLRVSELLIKEHPRGLLAPCDDYDFDEFDQRIGTKCSPLRLNEKYGGDPRVKSMLRSTTTAVRAKDYEALASRVCARALERLCNPPTHEPSCDEINQKLY
jgi:hypothetical protein